MFPLSPVDFTIQERTSFNDFSHSPHKDLRHAQGKNSAKVNVLIGALRAGKAGTDKSQDREMFSGSFLGLDLFSSLASLLLLW